MNISGKAKIIIIVSFESMRTDKAFLELWLKSITFYEKITCHWMFPSSLVS